MAFSSSLPMQQVPYACFLSTQDQVLLERKQGRGELCLQGTVSTAEMRKRRPSRRLSQAVLGPELGVLICRSPESDGIREGDRSPGWDGGRS